MKLTAIILAILLFAFLVYISCSRVTVVVQEGSAKNVDIEEWKVIDAETDIDAEADIEKDDHRDTGHTLSK